ncbi:hypothetical protein ARMSODRAFT_958705 [Armillaria solidipes]|uniref:Uncharacterized protein n=1 Tax=Armillaria solidipes TaxID=1076256 RepID=A0A2H3BL26_9AGAR|nr:hypothetical protein ARMSODRAFT_958705 [Armillaria solidipes]
MVRGNTRSSGCMQAVLILSHRCYLIHCVGKPECELLPSYLIVKTIAEAPSEMDRYHLSIVDMDLLTYIIDYSTPQTSSWYDSLVSHSLKATSLDMDAPERRLLGTGRRV